MITPLHRAFGLLCLAICLLLIVCPTCAWADLVGPPPVEEPGGDSADEPGGDTANMGAVGVGIALSTVIAGGFVVVVLVRRRHRTAQ